MDALEQQQDELDFLIYEQMYAESLAVSRKPRTVATAPGKVVHEGTPLDFSFLKLQDVIALAKERPRAGKRIAIEKDEDEEEGKKDSGAALAAEDKGDGEAKEGKTSMVIKNTAVPQVANILQNHSISLSVQKNGMMGGRKQDDGNVEAARKKELEFTRTSLLLNNNELRTLSGMFHTLDTYVMRAPRNLLWLNLSYNYLTKIDVEILEFPNLKSLQLHGNYIGDLAEVEKLSKLECLISLTLNGNPIEAIKGYRMYVLGLLYKERETLKKLDSTVITNAEYDNAVVWNQRLYTDHMNKLSRLSKRYFEKEKLPLKTPPPK